MRRIDHRRFKDELNEQFACVGAALGSPRRLEILDLLAQRERTVEDLAVEAGLSVANASRHLRVLAAAGLVSVRRSGTFAHYRIASARVVTALRAIAAVAEERLPQVRASLERHVGPRSVEELSPAAVRRRVAGRKATLVDVRPQPEYAAGHIPGAVSLPIEALSRRNSTSALPHGREVIVYCRGPYCVWADEAVEVLRRRGFTAHRLLLGAPDWSALGAELDVAG
jgi:rhodanese-related sulfurtransferase/DNA-binding transcriptional ArsR family regulator